MALLTDDEVLTKIIVGEVEVADGIAALIDRSSGRFSPPEGQLIDYKATIKEDDIASIAELSRDILGFSNTDGGLLICGVDDATQAAIGHAPVDFRKLREMLGLFLGTRVNYDMDECTVRVRGSDIKILVMNVPRSSTVYPNLYARTSTYVPGWFGRSSTSREPFFIGLAMKPSRSLQLTATSRAAQES